MIRALAAQGLTVEDNLTLLFDVRWDKGLLRYANLQAIWAEVALVELTESYHHQYLRLDYDLTAMGPLLKESQPHIHVQVKGDPRFPVPIAEAEYPIGWFLDFVYRSFFYDEWSQWAKSCWSEDCKARRRENRWERLQEAFNSSKPDVIKGTRELNDDLRALKALLRTKRKDVFPFPVDRTNLELFSNDLA